MKRRILGERIKEARIEKKLTQKEVSGDFITRNMLSQIENGLASPSIKTIEYLAKKLENPVAYFMDAMVDEDLNHDSQIFELDNLINRYLKNDWDGCIKGLDKIIKDIDTERTLVKLREVYLLMYLCLANKGFESFHENKLKIAQEHFKKAIFYDNKTLYDDKYLKSKILMYLTRISLKFNNIEEAENYNIEYENLLSLKELTVQNFFIKGEILYKKEEYEKIIVLTQNINNDDIKEIGAYYFLLGRVLYKQGDFNKAIDSFIICYEKWKDTDKSIVDLNKYISDCYSKIGNFEKAYEFLKKNS